MKTCVPRRGIYICLGVFALFLLAFFQSSTIKAVAQKRDFEEFGLDNSSVGDPTTPEFESKETRGLSEDQEGPLWQFYIIIIFYTI